MKKSKSPAEQITAARAVSPRKALALTAAVLAARHYCHRMLRYRPDRNRTGKPG
jgi:DMSO/TMAO reductase YedYZ heme-binding membrane subunit